jgi:spoIIIJ-associated protein
MESIEAEAESIDAAIEAALKTLGVSRDRVEIEILSNAARGLFGIGSRKARVRATLRSPVEAEFREEAREGSKTAGASERSPAAAVDGQLAERARHVLQEIITLMNLNAAVTARTQDDHILLELTGDASGVLIGRRGKMLDALEYVLNRIVARDEGDAPRVVIDSENYRARRREALENLARRMGEQAKRKKRAITLNPMNPRDRRIVHLALRGDPSLTTKSSGKGYFRKLIIIPEGVQKVASGGG